MDAADIPTKQTLVRTGKFAQVFDQVHEFSADEFNALRDGVLALRDVLGGVTIWKAACRVCIDTNVVSLSGLGTYDSVALNSGDRVLLIGQSTARDNGIWSVAGGAWTRATDASSSAQVTAGMMTVIEEGTVYASALIELVTPAPIVLGTTALTFARKDTRSLAPFSNYSATRAPLVTDDNTAGFAAGSVWIWPGHGAWLCGDASTGAALWLSYLTSGDLSNSTPQPIGTAAPGSGNGPSRSDHVHAHGNQAGGTLHAEATDSVDGFMSAADKTRFDAFPLGAYAATRAPLVTDDNTAGFAPGSVWIWAGHGGWFCGSAATGAALWLQYLSTGDLSNSTPQPLGTAAAGDSGSASRSNHVHAMPRLDQVAVPTADVSLNSHKLTNITDPTSAQDAATRIYADQPSTRTDSTTTPAVTAADIGGFLKLSNAGSITLSTLDLHASLRSGAAIIISVMVSGGGTVTISDGSGCTHDGSVSGTSFVLWSDDGTTWLVR